MIKGGVEVDRKIVNQEAYNALTEINEQVKQHILKNKLPNTLFTGIGVITPCKDFIKKIFKGKKREWCYRWAVNLSDYLEGWEIDVDWHATITIGYEEGFCSRFELCFVDFGIRAIIREMTEMTMADGYFMDEDRALLRKLEQIKERAHRDLKFITHITAETETEFLEAIAYTIYTARGQLLELFGEVELPYTPQPERNTTISDLLEQAFGELPYRMIQLEHTKSLADTCLSTAGADKEQEDEEYALLVEQLMSRIW